MKRSKKHVLLIILTLRGLKTSMSSFTIILYFIECLGTQKSNMKRRSRTTLMQLISWLVIDGNLMSQISRIRPMCSRRATSGKIGAISARRRLILFSFISGQNDKEILLKSLMKKKSRSCRKHSSHQRRSEADFMPKVVIF